jgi:hypothetical protein
MVTPATMVFGCCRNDAGDQQIAGPQMRVIVVGASSWTARKAGHDKRSGQARSANQWAREIERSVSHYIDSPHAMTRLVAPAESNPAAAIVVVPCYSCKNAV